MKILFTLSAIVLSSITLSAQQSALSLKGEKYINKADGVISVVDSDYFNQLVKSNSVIDVYVNDFSVAGDWTAENASSPPVDWVIGSAAPAGDFSDGMGAITSTSGGNFALFDSDAIGSGTSAQDSWIQNTDPIDLSLYPNVLLSFESYYRAFQGGCVVEVSNDGDNWTFIDIHADIAVNASTENPQVVTLNVSSTIGGSATAYVRFRYIGGWDYAWMVDDVVIFEQLANDLKMNYSLVSHLPETGLEYGRVPVSQMNDVTLGAEFMNFGTDTQVNSVVAIEMLDESGTPVVSTSTTAVDLPSGDTTFVETLNNVAWALGDYTTSFELTSDTELAGSANFDDNTDSRVMAISNVYGLDGIDVYPNSVITSLGTASFTDAADGLMLMTRYDITAETTAFGVEAVLNTAGTDAGAEIIAVILTYDDVDGENVISDFWLTQSDDYEVTADDVSNGYINLLFEDEITLEPGSYYVGLLMNSLSGSSNIAIVDDTTVPQPADGSVIYIDGDAVFTNGNALALRMMMDDLGASVSIEEVAQVSLVGQNVPNPAIDQTRIDFELLSAQQVQITVTDITGRIVMDQNLGNLSPGQHQHLMDVRSLSAGNHFYTIRTAQGIVTQKMTIIK
jgi:hypothetical protein